MTGFTISLAILLLVGECWTNEDWSTVNFPAGTIAPCQDNKEYCETDDDYPFTQSTGGDALIHKLFKAGGGEEGQQINIRIGGESDLVQESPACDSRKSVVYPRKAQNTAGSYMFILNTNEYKQAVEVEQCIGEGQKCRTDDDAPQAGLTACRQKYTVYKMLALDSQGKEILDTFSLPSACLCYYQDKPFGLRSSFEDVPVISVCNPADGPPQSSPVPTCLPPRQSQQRGGSVVFGGDRKRRQADWDRRQADSDRRQASREGRQAGREGRHLLHRHHPWPRHHHQRDFTPSAGLIEPASGCDSAANYCEAAPCYPELHALGQLDQEAASPLLDQLFRDPCTDQLDGIVTRRFNINEQPLCEGVKKVIFPRQALNLRNEWKYVVNVGNYTQAVEVEECNPKRLNSSGGIQTADGFSQSYGSCLYGGSKGLSPSSTVCRQLYSKHKLLSLSGDGQLVLDTFRLPVACDCYIRESFQLEFKSGARDGG